MAPLKIPTSAEKRILQTYASNECWGEVLLVQDNNNKRHVCGYKSGTFKASEQHYHSTFKEILTVKQYIEKFQFHLIGPEFQVEMDMSSFPRMLQFKIKMLPHAQLSRAIAGYAPVQSTSAPEFVRHENGLVEIKPKSENVFRTEIHMITPTDQEPAQEVKHIWWDVCNCESCLDEAVKIDDDEDLPKKRKSSQQKLKRRYEKAEPSQPLSPPHKTPPSPHKPPATSPPPPKLSPYNQKALSILYQDSPVFPITKDPSCSYSQEYEQEFPALTAFEHLDSRTKCHTLPRRKYEA
ncbi:putative zinc finger, CCHC-type containing protein [Tanacetum coccineum]